jgi:hypothetical protein
MASEMASSRSQYLTGGSVPLWWYQRLCRIEKPVWPLRCTLADPGLSLVWVCSCGGIGILVGSETRYGQRDVNLRISVSHWQGCILAAV